MLRLQSSEEEEADRKTEGLQSASKENYILTGNDVLFNTDK